MGLSEPTDVQASVRFRYRVKPRQIQAGGAAALELQTEAAELALLGVPIEVPEAEARRYLDRNVTVTPSGSIKTTTDAAKQLSGQLSAPGIDPQRLYAILWPVTFPGTRLDVGATWTGRAPFLAAGPSLGAFRARRTGTATVEADYSLTYIEANGSGAAPSERASRGAARRVGSVRGKGKFEFDPGSWALVRGDLTLHGTLGDAKPAKPAKAGGQTSRVTARITVNLIASSDPPPAPQEKQAP